MSEIIENAGANSTENADTSFEEMLEESLKSLNTDEKVHGVVVGIAPNEVYVDVGRKQAGFIPVAELSADPNAKPEDLVKIGDEMDLLIMRTNDQEGTIMLSKKRLDAAKGWETVAAAEESQEILTGVVTEVIKGGVIAVTNGVRVFIPASQATASRNDPLEDLLKKEVRFRIIEVNRNRRRAVGSIRSVLKDERKALADKFWETAEVGKEYTGVVKSLTAYGAFVDLGGIDGLVHISELSWNHVNHPSEVVKVGDEVEVEVLDVDLQRERISLGLKQTTPDPWIKLVESYPVGTIVDGRVTKVVPFGAFVELGQGIEGLVHISEMAPRHIDTPAQVVKANDTVKVKVMDVNPERRRISLSMKAAAEELGIEIEVDESIQAEERPAKRKNDKKREEKQAEETAAASEEKAE